MKFYALLTLLALLFFPEAYGIIYRHDVSEQKYRALAQQSQFHCVGEVFEGMIPVGSCVLVGDRWVLSAAHVFIKSDIKLDTVTLSDKQIIIHKPVNKRPGNADEYRFRFQRKNYVGKSIKMLPGYLEKGDYDLVLIELAEPVKDVAPAIMAKSFDEKGAAVTIVGFGVSGNAADPDDVGPYYAKLAGQNTIDTLTGAEYKGQRTLLPFDFDHPTAKELSTMGSSVALPLESMCGGGDSGGGMFRERNGVWELAGICSGSATNIDKLLKTGYYGQEGSYTRVSAFYQWIKESMSQSGAQRK